MVRNIPQLHPDDKLWVIQPTRSLSWTQAKWVIGFFALFSLGTGGLFYLAGFPLVLPYSGIEVLALAIAFYHISSTGQWREVVRINREKLVIDSGHARAEVSHEFPLSWVQVKLYRSHLRWHPSSLYVRSHGREIEVGKFLSEDERKALAASLISAIEKNR